MTEKQLHKSVCEMISLIHPKIIFNTDLSGIRLTAGQANEIKDLRSNKGWPDIFIAEPRGWFTVDIGEHKNVKAFLFAGLYIELKKETPYKKDGSLKSQIVNVYKKIGRRNVLIDSYNHLEMQDNFHKVLRSKGYFACFSWSIDMTMKIIQDYLDN